MNTQTIVFRETPPLHYFETLCLTKNEKAVLQLLAWGYDSEEISETLHLGYDNVRAIRKALKFKFRARNIAHLSHLATKYKLID